MAFPTATVTQGSGLTINTLPNAGQATMANSLGVAIASDQSAFPVTSLSSGAITNPTSTLTRPANSVGSNVTVSTTVSPYFTWSGNPLVNGQGVILGGTTLPAGFNAGWTYYVRDVAGNTFNLAGSVGGAAIVPSSTGTAVTAELNYKPNDLIGSAAVAGSVVVPSFSIASAAGGAILPRIRIRTSVPSNWQGVNLSINLWSGGANGTTPPTYTNGDAQPYAVAAGSANWLGNFLVTLMQFGDGAVGAGQLTGANEMALKLASGTTVYWDLQILTYVAPAASQTFTLIPELLN
jgi:hypothetical protein